MDKKTPADKSLFYYGSLYNKLMDPLIKPARETVVKEIPAGAAVLDIGCGTGLLCIALKRSKDCRVTGIDLSRRMLEFAESINPYPEESVKTSMKLEGRISLPSKSLIPQNPFSFILTEPGRKPKY